MLYNQTKTNAGAVMPLLMGCTMPSAIESAEPDAPRIYDPIAQTVNMDMRIVGTYSLKQRTTKVGFANQTDRKNEIDDQKNVK